MNDLSSYVVATTTYSLTCQRCDELSTGECDSAEEAIRHAQAFGFVVYGGRLLCVCCFEDEKALEPKN